MTGEDPPNSNSNSNSTDPVSRPDSRVSQSELDEDESFVDVEESTTTTTTKEEEQEDTIPPTHLEPTSNSTAMSSQSSINLLKDPSLQLDPPQATADELVAFLRGQITDLTSQVTSLNGKLVKSYTTRGDLEDNLHESKEMEIGLRRRVKELEVDKERWTKEIEQGGWVERDHVQGEMQRLMTKVVEETQTRQTAVQAHSALENEVENLTSNLFAEANKMVAFERLARARAEEKTRSVEEAGISMQALLEDVQVGLRDTVTKLEKREGEVVELKRRLASHGEIVPEDPTERGMNGDGGEEGDLGGSLIFSDGQQLDLTTTATSSDHQTNTAQNGSMTHQFASPRLLTSAVPYQEFLTFITYLRQLRVTTLARPPDPPSAFGASAGMRGGFAALDPPPTSSLSPAQLLAPHLLLSTHLSQPFLKRCVEEDSDPALRLDLAPGLGFLSRRNVANAVVDGTLLIEPLSAVSEHPGDKCSLCGCNLEKWLVNSGMSRSKSTNSSSTMTATTTDQLGSTMKKMLGGRGWGFARSNSSNNTPTVSSTTSNSSPSAPTDSSTSFSFPSYSPSHHPLDHSLQIHIFRIRDTATQRYPICPSYCLARLRAVCEFWTYVRVIERGLLLEEGFKFVQGRGDTIPSSSRNQSTTSLVKGQQNEEKKSDEKEEEPRGLGIVEARDFEAQDTEIEGTPRIVEPEPTEEDEKESPSPSSEEKKEPQSSPQPQPDSSLPASPAISRPHSPTLTQQSNTSSGSLSKPNRPPRSSARGTASPALNSSPPSSPAAPPSLPPRRQAVPQPPPPRHPTAKEDKTGGELIASSTGWEDRCWSEVVRLKESVFWTRVAAVSSDGGVVSARGAKVWVQ